MVTAGGPGLGAASFKSFNFVLSRTRESLRGGVIWSALLVFILTFAIARSTVAAGWGNGIGVVTWVALGATVLLGVLALLPIPWPVGLGVGMVAGPIVAAIAAAPATQAPVDIHLAGVWWTRITLGNPSTDTAFYLLLICWLMWLTGGWLSWCVLRWRRPMLGLVPGAAAFATNLLNDPVPGDQNVFTLFVLVFTLALLLWTNYTSSIAGAARARVKLTGDARWDFWESGLVAMAALIVIGIMLPPMSTVDRTLSFENSAFSSWAQLEQRLNHPVQPGSSGGPAATTGFATDASLDSPLTRSQQVVFTFTKSGPYAGPLYFRGVDETQTSESEWRYALLPAYHEPVASGQSPDYLESYKDLALANLQVNMIVAPADNSDVLFYPGQIVSVDRDSVAVEAIYPAGASKSLATVDRLSSVQPSFSTGGYTITVEYSTATDIELRAAGTNYPDWLQPYMYLPDDGSYRPPDVVAAIRKLALQITDKYSNPYDKATAIESYLRDTTRFTYTLSPPLTFGRDPIDFFLFTSHKGFCAYFASAMGDLLRSIGIPTRLVSGFGPGTYDVKRNIWEVRGQDAHTWVESYFPGYGWITFEPTPDGVYTPVLRGTQGENVCLRDKNCDNPAPASTATAPPTHRPGGISDVAPGGSISGGSSGLAFRVPDAGTLTRIVAVLLAVMLLLLAATVRYLRPRTIAAVWKRTLTLARWAGAESRSGETPLELGRRLQRTFPEASEPVAALAGGFTIAAYAPPDLAQSAGSSVMEAWTALRPLLIRRVFARLRPNSY
jgi:transglutaminase-like putative cysteine protease